MGVESRRHARRLLRRAAAAHSLGKATDGYWSILSMIGVQPKCDRRGGRGGLGRGMLNASQMEKVR